MKGNEKDCICEKPIKVKNKVTFEFVKQENAQ
jgi:hypothetical protein